MSTVTFPLGPYHSALAEPLGLVVRARGETVVAVEDVRAGFCRRGVLERAEGQPIEDALVLFERSCSFAGHAHRLAFCQAIEDAQGLTITPPAALLRTAFAEIERMLARLWVLARTAQALGQHALARDAHDQRETLFMAAEEATGQRTYWGIPVPGGARDDIDREPLADALIRLAPALDVWQTVVSPTGRLGRPGIGVAPIPAAQAATLHLTGLAAVALGGEDDGRRLRPSEGYAQLDLQWPEPAPGPGDLAARLRAAVDDLAFSHHIATNAFEALNDAPIGAPVPAQKLKAPAPGRASVEGPHGAAEVALTLQPTGMVTAVALATPAGRMLDALPLALEGARLALAPAILASLDLCPECIDL